MYHPILEDVTRLLESNASKEADASTRKKNETISILTQTNEEAVIMLALLHCHGIKAKLVQSMDGLRFWNLAEVRYFLKKIDQGIKETKSPIIPDDIWEAAKQQTFQSMPPARLCHICAAVSRYLSRPIVPSTTAT